MSFTNFLATFISQSFPVCLIFITDVSKLVLSLVLNDFLYSLLIHICASLILLESNSKSTSFLYFPVPCYVPAKIRFPFATTFDNKSRDVPVTPLISALFIISAFSKCSNLVFPFLNRLHLGFLI